MKQICFWIMAVLVAFLLGACAAPAVKGPTATPQITPAPVVVESSSAPTASPTPVAAAALPENTDEPTILEEHTMPSMQVTVGGKTFSASLAQNDAVRDFVQMLKTAPVTLAMHDYGGFEKVGTLETGLPASNSQITTQSGDIVLYNQNQIVIFYGSNSWVYTKLGTIDDLSGWEEALGYGNVTVTFSTP